MFDEDPKRWRMLAETLATLGLSLEIATSFSPSELAARFAVTRDKRLHTEDAFILLVSAWLSSPSTAVESISSQSCHLHDRHWS